MCVTTECIGRLKMVSMIKMKIFKLSQDIVNGYDTYDSCVVIAENENEARKIHPSKYVTHSRDGKWFGTYDCPDKPELHGKEYESENIDRLSSWVLFQGIDKIKVEEIGEAKQGMKKGVVVSSFNAG